MKFAPQVNCLSRFLPPLGLFAFAQRNRQAIGKREMKQWYGSALCALFDAGLGLHYGRDLQWPTRFNHFLGHLSVVCLVVRDNVFESPHKQISPLCDQEHLGLVTTWSSRLRRKVRCEQPYW